MNRKSLFFGNIIGGLLLLSSCTFTLKSTFYQFASFGEIPPLIDATNYYHANLDEDAFTQFYQLNNGEYSRRYNLSSQGTNSVLVLPIDFPAYPASNLPGGSNFARTLIHNAFFGTEESSIWQSVASYYDQSSYGKFHLSGEVGDWYRVTDEEILEKITAFEDGNSSYSKTALTNDILRLAVANYLQGLTNQQEFVNQYDGDNNGIIDSVFLVYSHPIGNTSIARPIEKNDSGSLFWAFTAHDVNNGNLNLKANGYAWASYYFLYPDYSLTKNLPDTHTFIHEMGHLLGLEDYYNTSLNGTFSPTGGMDMMDSSLGDHTAFSKMLLGWTNPYVITSDGLITIRPFNASGDVILFSPSFDNSIFNEYYLLEFYAPTGLNYYDATMGSGSRLFTNYGLKLYHVNAEVTYRYKNDGVSIESASFRYNNSLTSALAEQGTPVLYELLAKSGREKLLHGQNASNEDIYYLGDKYNGDFSVQTDRGQALNIGFEVTNFSRSGITVRFAFK
ncbi:MAG: immune inhibitor A domain-containing protein [Bacilli bacterium]|jgi:M6 family metalloprotease-like protein